ncbi:MAG: MBL fold metallo-hydrolase [Victivallales bacterium]
MKNKQDIASAAFPTGEMETASRGVMLKYLGQAGFLLMRQEGKKIAIDPYLSNCVERIAGFKRMQPAMATPDSLEPDIVLSTHSHPDHLDVDAFPAFISRQNTFFIGAPDCEPAYMSLGIDKSRYKILRAGESTMTGGATIRATYADHGELAPDAVGFLIEIDGIKIYNVGDSGLSTDKILKSLGDVDVDIMIAPINGAFGNLNALEACALGAAVRPKMLMGCHFWMFVEQGGDPAAFLDESKRLGLNGKIMATGEILQL